MATRAPTKTAWWYKTTIKGKRKFYYCGIVGKKQGKGNGRTMCWEKTKTLKSAGGSKRKRIKKTSSKASSHDNGHSNEELLLTHFGYQWEQPNKYMHDERFHGVFGNAKHAEITPTDQEHVASNSFTSNALSKFLKITDFSQDPTTPQALLFTPESGLPMTVKRLRSGT